MITNVTILFFVLLIPVSGFIAWLGDRIGHKSGKKRHSVFGLRPRHTAMLFTIGSGVGISVVSFFLMYGLSQTFRVVVRDGAELYGHNRDLKRENENQARLLAATHNQAKQSKTEAEASRREAVRADADQAKATEARDKALAGLKAAQTDVQTASAKLTNARTELDREHQKLTNEQARLSSVQNLLSTKTKRVRAAEAEIKAAGLRVDAARAEVNRAQDRQRNAQAQMQTAEVKLGRVRAAAAAALEEQKRQQERTLANLKETLSDLTQQVADQKSKTEAERGELARVTRELEARRAELAPLLASADALRSKQITYHVGEEVARFAIPPGYSVWRIEAALDTFLTAASKKAEGRGAKKAGDGKSRAVFLFPQPLANAAANVPSREANVLASQKDTTAFGEIGGASEASVLQTTAIAIRKANEDVVVVALAASNAVAGEPVAVQLRTFRNPVVLQADAPLGEIVLDGNASREAIADGLYSFLRQDIRKKLLDAGIIPPLKGGEVAEGEAAPPSVQNAESIVSLSGNEWLQVMDDIRKTGSRARVIVRTGHALRAGDTVVLRFEVKDQQSSGSVRPSW